MPPLPHRPLEFVPDDIEPRSDGGADVVVLRPLGFERLQREQGVGERHDRAAHGPGVEALNFHFHIADGAQKLGRHGFGFLKAVPGLGRLPLPSKSERREIMHQQVVVDPVEVPRACPERDRRQLPGEMANRLVWRDGWVPAAGCLLEGRLPLAADSPFQPMDDHLALFWCFRADERRGVRQQRTVLRVE